MNRINMKWALIGIALLLAAGCGRTSAAQIRDLSALEANNVIQENQNNSGFVILDVRTPKEFAQGHIAGARLLDYTSPQFKAGLERLDRTKAYLVYCRTGNRSGRALKLFEALGFKKVYHLNAGITDWVSQKLPIVQ